MPEAKEALGVRLWIDTPESPSVWLVSRAAASGTAKKTIITAATAITPSTSAPSPDTLENRGLLTV